MFHLPHFIYSQFMICCHSVLLTVPMPIGQVRKPCFNKASFTSASVRMGAWETDTKYVSTVYCRCANTHHVCTVLHLAIRAYVAHVGAQCKSKMRSLAKVAGQQIGHGVDRYMIWSPGSKHTGILPLKVQHHAMYVVPGAQAESAQASYAVLEYTWCSSDFAVYMWWCWVTDLQFVLIQCCIFVAPYCPDVWLSRTSTCGLKQKTHGA